MLSSLDPLDLDYLDLGLDLRDLDYLGLDLDPQDLDYRVQGHQVLGLFLELVLQVLDSLE